MVDFIEARFPVSLSYGSGGGPVYNTDIITLASGHEQRNVNWSQSKARYNVSMGLRTQSQLEVVIAFFRSMSGQAYGFRFRDWTDFKLQAGTIATGDGFTTDFRINKVYSNGVTQTTRDLYKIVSDADAQSIADEVGNTPLLFAVTVNGAVQIEGVHYNVDRDNGNLSFASAPSSGHAIVVSCEFDVPVRFATDSIVATIDSHSANSVNNVTLVEVRP